MRILSILCAMLLFTTAAGAAERHPVGFTVRLVAPESMTVQNPDPVHDGIGLQDRTTYRAGDTCTAAANGTFTVIGTGAHGLSVIYYTRPRERVYGCPSGTITYLGPERLNQLAEAARVKDAAEDTVAREHDRLRQMIREHESKTTRRMWGP